MTVPQGTGASSSGKSHSPTGEKYIGVAGKPSALKDARSVWSGGKAERPYLSLFGEKHLLHVLPGTHQGCHYISGQRTSRNVVAPLVGARIIQPVIPAEATERRNHLWKSRKTINMNMVIMLAKAMMSPQCSGDWAKKTRIPTITGR